MSIVSSFANIDKHAQQDGARYVVEIHTDQDGKTYQAGPYLAPARFDVDARLASRALEISAHLADAEAAALLGVD